MPIIMAKIPKDSNVKAYCYTKKNQERSDDSMLTDTPQSFLIDPGAGNFAAFNTKNFQHTYIEVEPNPKVTITFRWRKDEFHISASGGTNDEAVNVTIGEGEGG